MKTIEPNDRIITALDVTSPKEAMALVKELAGKVGAFKIGLQLINNMLASIIVPEDEQAILNLKSIREFFKLVKGKVFWDGKLKDIPNTLGKCSIPLSQLGLKMFNVHASSGIAAMNEVVANKGDSLVLAVTVLTSLEENAAHLIYGAPSKAKVLQFARDALVAGVDGIICSPKELKFLSGYPETAGLLRVTPGVYPEWVKVSDQKRTATPKEALKNGADYMVIGRSITDPPDEVGTPSNAVEKIVQEIKDAMN